MRAGLLVICSLVAGGAVEYSGWLIDKIPTAPYFFAFGLALYASEHLLKGLLFNIKLWWHGITGRFNKRG